MDLSRIKKIYMIGVKGVGMTMLAQYFRGQGIRVLGSDGEEKFMTDEVLRHSGVTVIEKFDKANIPSDADLIIYSSAYNPENNEEVKAALAGSKKVLNYAEALGAVFNQKYGIAVVGSHGKTTTTAWLGYVMDCAGLKPTVMVGARVNQFNGNTIVGASDYLVAEADEYQNKLKNYNPRAVLLNNIDYDHPDFFATREDYEKVFIDFIKKIPKKGFLIANFDDLIIEKIARVNCLGRVISYGLKNQVADFMAYDLQFQNEKQYFKVKMDGDDLGDFNIQLSGEHNVYNALAVIAAGIELEIDLLDIRKYLAEFTGTARRMQVLGEFNGAVIIDDYAHHPTEIKATLQGIREKYGNKKIIAVFHPHTFTRTKALLDDFAKSFNDADEVIVLDIYGSAREQQGGVHSQDLINQLIINNEKLIIKQEVKYIADLKECEEYLRKNIKGGEVVLLMGAGDVFRVGERLIGSK
jgi:UDP-N-acetylmuramate--alanine ligase